MRAGGHFRLLRQVGLLAALSVGVSGCHHKQAVVLPPGAGAPTIPQQSAANVPPGRPGANPSAGTAPGLPSEGEPLQPEGKPTWSEVGIASWYGPGFEGHKVADGTIFDPKAFTAAHRELPLGTIIRVTNLTNNEQVLLRINDHGPFMEGRILDLTPTAAKAIDMYRAGIARVRLEAWPPPAGSDPAGKWCVQIGAFSHESDAVRLKNQLLRRYSTANVIEFAGATGHWVRIKPKDQDRATAEQMMEHIHVPDDGAQPYLVRLN